MVNSVFYNWHQIQSTCQKIICQIYAITSERVTRLFSSTQIKNANKSKLTINPETFEPIVVDRTTNYRASGIFHPNKEELLNERLTQIEQMLCLITRDLEMESRYPKLKKIFDEYMNELEKYKMWEKINA